MTNQLTIKSEDPILINALTFWFENGDAQEAFLESRHGETWREVKQEQGRPAYLETYPQVDFDGYNDTGVDHIIILDE